MMRYACCKVDYDVLRKRFVIKVLALFQNLEDAEELRFSLPCMHGRPADLVDIMTGEDLTKPDISIEYLMNTGLSYDDANRMRLLNMNRQQAVREYCKGWRKRNGITDEKEKSA